MREKKSYSGFFLWLDQTSPRTIRTAQCVGVPGHLMTSELQGSGPLAEEQGPEIAGLMLNTEIELLLNSWDIAMEFGLDKCTALTINREKWWEPKFSHCEYKWQTSKPIWAIPVIHHSIVYTPQYTTGIVDWIQAELEVQYTKIRKVMIITYIHAAIGWLYIPQSIGKCGMLWVHQIQLYKKRRGYCKNI